MDHPATFGLDIELVNAASQLTTLIVEVHTAKRKRDTWANNGRPRLAAAFGRLADEIEHDITRARAAHPRAAALVDAMDR